MQILSETIDSLPSVNPELSLDRNSEIKSHVCVTPCLIIFICLSELTGAKASLVTQCILYVGSKTISHTFLALTK